MPIALMREYAAKADTGRMQNAAIIKAGFEHVRLVGPTGEQLGEMSAEAALEMAKERKLDLTMMAEKAKPPVCKLLDPKEARVKRDKQKANEKKQRAARPTIKDMRVSETIGEHDMAIKVKKVREFLGKQYQVRVFMNNFKDAKKARDVLEQMNVHVEDVSVVMDLPRVKGRKMTLQLGPRPPE